MIRIRGAKANNLKNVDLDIPQHKLVVFTGVSGSGKSSLAFDTIYAEGQRRYVESLSSYARQFLGMMEKPDVDLIEGLSPAISIDQKSAGHNPRSTVGTVTEIYDYLRLLFARVGHPRSPVTGEILKKQSIQEIVDKILKLNDELKIDKVKVQILSPIIKNRKGTYEELFRRFQAQGYARVRVDGEVFSLEETIKIDKFKKHSIDLVIDRLIIESDKSSDKEFIKRLTDSIELAVNMGEGEVLVNLLDFNDIDIEVRPQSEDIFFSENLVDPSSGKSFPEVAPHSFSFNSPHGACQKCSGLGIIKEIDPSLIYNPRLTLAEGAIYPWSRTADNPDSWRMKQLIAVSESEGFSIDVPMMKLEEKHLKLVLYGNNKKYKIKYKPSHSNTENTYQTEFEGVIPNLMRRYSETDSDFIRKEIEQYMTEHDCDTCKGYRLRQESLSVTLEGLNIVDVTDLPIDKCIAWISNISSNDKSKTPLNLVSESLKNLFDLSIDERSDQLSNLELEIGKQIFKEIKQRLTFLESVGLNYLTLSRKANTLSGGESQRIRLASQIGTGLTGVLYVLDEPSIGLHQRDNDKLIQTLISMRDLGNTVIVVEHDEETIQAADFIVDIGPDAGEHGGEIVAFGEVEDIKAENKSITGKYLSGKRKINNEEITKELESIGRENTRVHSNERLLITGIDHNNLNGIDVEIPLKKFIAVTGVSGSGKSSMVNGVLSKILGREINRSKEVPGNFSTFRGTEHIDKLVKIDQSPIGRTPRSNPATYTGVFTEIRNIFANTQEAKSRGYKPGRFSFNVKGGRCENCSGDGLIKIEMQFLPDVYVKCDVCNGQRYSRDTLQIDFKGKNIADVLNMTVEEATDFFQNIPTIYNKLSTLHEVGLSYIRLGQSATTLSGGEAQRVKLASELSKRQTGSTFYILDEPTTGLHFEDVRKLLIVLHGLVAKGNTVLVIEHNLDVVKTVDHIIDIGPEGGKKGGYIIAEGTPEEIAEVKESYTGMYLKKMIKK